MTPEITAAVIGVGGAVVLAAAGNLLASVYFAGRIARGFEDHERRITTLETAERQTALTTAKLEVLEQRV